MSVAAMSHSDRNVSRMVSCNRIPTTPMGMVPAIMYHPSRASARCSGVSVRPEAFPRENTLKNQERMMLPMSRAKYKITASSVPI